MKLHKIYPLAGMLSVLYYTSHVVIGGWLWRGYSHLQQPISDLTATGAPNRPLVLTLSVVYGIFALLFAVLFTVIENKQFPKVVLWGGACFIAVHVCSVSYLFFPEDLPGAEVSFPGMMHIVVTALIVPFTILSPLLLGMGFRKVAGWQQFGTYSIATGLLIIIFGGTTAIFYAKKLPYFGLVERINIGLLQLWTLMFSLKLMNRK